MNKGYGEQMNNLTKDKQNIKELHQRFRQPV